MKLRIRSAATKETIRVDPPDTSSLFDLKTLIASRLSSSFTAPIPPEAVHLSLNQADEIIASSPGESLTALGLTSGDLLFYTLDSGFYSATGALIPSSVSPVETLAELSSTPAVMDSAFTSLDSIPEMPDDVMDDEMEAETFVLEKVMSVPCFLRRVMGAEKGKISGNLGISVGFIHAVFLESGFVTCNIGDGSSLPEGCASAAHLVSVMYTIPDLINRGNMEDAKNVILKFSAVRNHVSVYGCLVGARPDVYRLSLDSSKLAPLLASNTNVLSGKEEVDLFQLWKVAKDRLSMPLLIDICQMNGLLLPPCFARLPTELKIIILEFLPGIDLANVACTCSELRYLASNDELWRRKVLEEFKTMGVRNMGGSWKENFVRFFLKKKKPRIDRSVALAAYIGAPRPLPIMIGGDHDIFPAIGGLGSFRRVGFNHHPGRRNFSPNCNLTGGGFT